jgi:hypothetical protein
MAEQTMDQFLSQFDEEDDKPQDMESFLGQFDEAPPVQPGEEGVDVSPLPTEPAQPPVDLEALGIEQLPGEAAPSLPVTGPSPTEVAFREKGVLTDFPSEFSERAYVELTKSLDSERQVTVLNEAFEGKVRRQDGELQRLVVLEDGSKRWALVNEMGLTADDITSYIVGEGLPFLMSVGGGGAAGAATIASGPGAIVAGVVGDAAGTYFGHVSNLLLMKYGKGISDEALSDEEILTGGPAKEALLALVGTVGVQSLMGSVKAVYKMSTGKNISDGVVTRLREALTEQQEVQAGLLKGVREATGEDITLTVGEASGDDLALSLEHSFRQNVLAQKDLTKFDADPMNEVSGAEAIVRSVEGWVKRNSDEAAGKTVDAENIIRTQVRAEHKAIQDGITLQRQNTEATLNQSMEKLRAKAPGTFDFQDALRGSIQTVRDGVDNTFAGRYDELEKTYGNLKGPNTHIAAFKEDLAERESLVLEKALTSNWKKFMSKELPEGDVTAIVDEFGRPLRTFSTDEGTDLIRRAMTPGATLTYQEVNTTLKLVRATIRDIREHGKSADSPNVATLKQLQAAYARQRNELAALAPDGGQQLRNVDAAYKIAKSEVDNAEVNRIMSKVGDNFELGGVELANYIFTPKVSALVADGDDVIARLIPIMDGEPGLRRVFNKSVKGVYARRVKNQADHNKFVQEFEGAFKDIYGGGIPKNFKDADKLFKEIAKRDEEMDAAVKAMGLDPLNPASVKNHIRNIVENGDQAAKARLDSFMEDNPELQQMYVSSYMNTLLLGGQRGFQGVVKSTPDGNRFLDISALRKVVGATKGEEGVIAIDAVADKYLSDAQRLALSQILEVGELTQRGISVGDTVKYQKSKWAHAIQLYLGPLTRGTRFSNTADVYLQNSAGRALIEAMANPKKLKALLDKYPSPNAWRNEAERYMYNLGAREGASAYNDDDQFMTPASIEDPLLQEAVRAAQKPPEEEQFELRETPLSEEEPIGTPREKAVETIRGGGSTPTTINLPDEQAVTEGGPGDALSATTDLNALFQEARRRKMLA